MFALGRATEFWESLANLCEPESDIRKDEKTASEIEGLWPACCSADMERFREKMKSNELFPLVQDQKSRTRIQAKIESLNYRVPSLRVIIAESRTLQCIVRWLLRGLGDGRTLVNSNLTMDQKRGTVADEKQYYLCFLAAARACGRNNEQILRGEIEHILDSGADCEPFDPHIESLRYPAGKTWVSAPPDGVWAICSKGAKDVRYPLVTNYFHLRVLCHPDSGSDSLPGPGKLAMPFLTMQFLTKDFFESFFGPADRFCKLVDYEDPTCSSRPWAARDRENTEEAWFSDEDILYQTRTTSSPLLANLPSDEIPSVLLDGQPQKDARRFVVVESSERRLSLKGEVYDYAENPVADAERTKLGSPYPVAGVNHVGLGSLNYSSHSGEASISDDETLCPTDTTSSPSSADLPSNMALPKAFINVERARSDSVSPVPGVKSVKLEGFKNHTWSSHPYTEKAWTLEDETLCQVETPPSPFFVDIPSSVLLDGNPQKERRKIFVVENSEGRRSLLGKTSIYAESILVDREGLQPGSSMRTQETSITKNTLISNTLFGEIPGVRGVQIPKHNWRGITYQTPRSNVALDTT